MAQQVKNLLYEDKDLSSDLKHPHKKLVMVACIRNPSNYRVREDPRTCWPTSLAQVKSQAPPSVRNPV